MSNRSTNNSSENEAQSEIRKGAIEIPPVHSGNGTEISPVDRNLQLLARTLDATVSNQRDPSIHSHLLKNKEYENDTTAPSAAPGPGRQSTAKHFEPKFYKIYEAYIEARKLCPAGSAELRGSLKIDLSFPLMSLCIDHLVEFCCWARSSDEIVTWMKDVVDNCPDLRPEVRNGLVMIMMYVFASAKAKFGRFSDMFGVLQHPEDGMGIISKTSLKVYNDPFHYFNFLKYTCTGLIDVGQIPENERLNQVVYFY